MKSIPNTIRQLCLLSCVAAVPISAHAQVPTVNLQFVSFPKAANPVPVELLIGEGKAIEVEIPTNGISKTYQVPALATWALGKSSVDEEGKPSFQIYGKAQSIGATDQLILVVRKGLDDAGGLELNPLKMDGEGFGGGKYFLLNATQVDIAGAIGTAKFSLKPNKFEMIAPEPTKTNEDQKYCFAQIYFRQGEEIQPFFSATWRFNEKARSMVFFYHDPTTKQLRIHTIRSFVR